MYVAGRISLEVANTQRPYAIATAGTPLSSSYDPATALFTHRFTDTPQRTAQGKPPRARVTEIFLPRRHYREGEVKWYASGGGHVQFDWARQRLFLWFDDSDEFVHRGKPMTRRIDVWVRETADRANAVEVIGLSIVLGAFIFFLANEYMRYTTGKPWVEMEM